MIKLNGHLVNVTMFPDKTSQVWKLSNELLESEKNCSKYIITWDFQNEGEIFQIFQLLHFFMKDDINKPVILNCPYMPYSRQDKILSDSSCFALTTFCQVFSWIEELQTFDVHNPSFFEDKEICPFKFTNTLPYKEVNQIISDEKIDLLIYPDKGASLRYPQLSKKHLYCSADKVRDQSTGEITGITVPSLTIGSSILVVDDLADGSKTFIELSKVIKQYNPVKLILYVSHGIFSKGTKIVFDAGYDKIFTKDGLVENKT